MHTGQHQFSPESEPTLSKPLDDDSLVRIGRLTIDITNRDVRIDDEPVQLTSGEFDILMLVAAQPGKVVTRDELCRALFGIEYDGLNRAVDIRVARLRRKLGDCGRSATIIKSVYGVGYLLATD